MALLNLFNGGCALIDDDDLPLVANGRWKRFTAAPGYHYVATRGKRPMLLHRWLMLPPSGMVVDHINGDTLDNRRENLRVCTHQQNMRNRRKARIGACTYKGVYFRAGKNRWHANIKENGRHVHLGSFRTQEAAAAAYDIAALLRFGEFACLNFPHVFPEIGFRAA